MSCNFTGELQPSGLAQEAVLRSTKLCSSPQLDIQWVNAELRIAELLSLIQPNGVSELQRKAVADYVSRLVHKCLGCEVFKFGSVPLKTYLPDGDIDLTAFSQLQQIRDTWASDVQTILEYEEQRRDAEYRVSKVQCIHAEVKIVKCVVEDLVVDISFNQLGGLCTLCFLEEVDRLIQKNHLFKRSILLVKAWCYYESRILGAHHGLISTYALETLVLYIFNVFHSILQGPLEVLFTFLDYFSNFDWERYCVSLWGPVPLAKLPDLTAEPPLKDGGKLLLSKDFLESCSALYDVVPKGQDTQSRSFGGKFLNIVDPLRTNNNLGRSVSQGNYHRIRSAFRRGACKLAELVEAVDDDFPKYLDEFFSNTWERHQNSCRPDAPSKFPAQQMFVYKGDPLEMPHSSNQANDVLGMHSMVPLSEKTIINREALNSHSPSSTLMKDISMSTCDMPFIVSTDSQLKTSSLGSSISVSSRSSKQRPEFEASLRRTISEGRIEKNFDAGMVKNRSLPVAVQDFKGWQAASENASNEVWKIVHNPLEEQQGKAMPKSSKIGSGSSKVQRTKSSRSWITLDSHESTQHSISSNATTNDVPNKCISSTVKNLTASNTAPQKPPGFLFPESHHLLYAPDIPPLSLPSFSSSPASFVSSFSSAVDPSSPDLDAEKTKTAQVHTTAILATLPVTPTRIPQAYVPSLPSHDGVQSLAKPTPWRSCMNASHSCKEVEQQSHFLQRYEQCQPPSHKPVQFWSHSSEVLPASQVVKLERNHADVSSSNARVMPHSESRMTVASNAVENGSIKTHETIPLHAEDLGDTAKVNEKMKPEKRGFLDVQRKKGDLYRGCEGATHTLPALASEVNANPGSDFLEPSTKRAPRSSDSDRHNLPGYVPYFGQPFPTFEAMKVVRRVPDVAQQPGVYVDSSESHSFGMPGNLVNEGGNQHTQAMYVPIGAFPTVSYYNSLYSILPTNHDHMDSEPEERSPQAYHASKHKLKSTTAAAMSERFAALSAEGARIEPPMDLLRSDLANHIRNLQFGRWCQEPVSQPHIESPYWYDSAQGPVLWGVSPAIPLQGIIRPFSHVFGDVKGLIGVPLTPQSFGGIPHNLPWPGTAEIGDGYKQKAGTGTFLPSRDAIYGDMKSCSPQIAAQGSLQWRQGDMNTWRVTQGSMMNHPSAIPSSVTSPSDYGAHNGVGVFGSSISKYGVTRTCLPDHFPDRGLPLVARHLEFGSLGPIEITRFSDHDAGTKQYSQYSSSDTVLNSFSPLVEKDIKQTMPNIQR